MGANRRFFLTILFWTIWSCSSPDLNGPGKDSSRHNPEDNEKAASDQPKTSANSNIKIPDGVLNDEETINLEEGAPVANDVTGAALNMPPGVTPAGPAVFVGNVGATRISGNVNLDFSLPLVIDQGQIKPDYKLVIFYHVFGESREYQLGYMAAERFMVQADFATFKLRHLGVYQAGWVPAKAENELSIAVAYQPVRAHREVAGAPPQWQEFFVKPSSPEDANFKPTGRSLGAHWYQAATDSLLVFGGQVGVVGSDFPDNDLWRLQGNSWQLMAPGSAALSSPLARRSSAFWTDAQGKFWMFGGWAGLGTPMGDLWMLDPESLQWSLKGDTSGPGAPARYPDDLGEGDKPWPGPRAHASFAYNTKQGAVWMYGGHGVAKVGNLVGALDDLWLFDGQNWTYLFGSRDINQKPVYQAKGTSPENSPGARMKSATWIDENGNFWLFGGETCTRRPPACSPKELHSDLWKFNPTVRQWSWEGGGKAMDTPTGQSPGARSGALVWQASQVVWMFGGTGIDSSGQKGNLQDLWKFDQGQWLHVNGNTTANRPSTPAYPGARSGAMGWRNGQGEFLFFGGYGYGHAMDNRGYQSDIWIFRP